MSTEVDVFQSGAVATTSRRDDGFTANITGSSITSKRISIRNNVFRLMVNGKEIDKSESRHLDVVIVNASPYVHRMYFAGEYKPGQKVSPPACWTQDSIKPDAEVPNPQSATCADCPQNIKGSGPNGTKACRFSRRIAVVKADDMNGDVYQVTLPAQSIFGNGSAERRPLHEYTDYVRANNQNLMSVVSRMSFDMDSSSTKIGFKPIRILNDEEYDVCLAKSKSDDSKRAIQLTVNVNKEEDEEANSQPAPAPQAKREADPFPKAEVVEEEDIPEPVKRAEPKVEPKPQPVQQPKADINDVSLDDLVSDWS
jgi:hypothetical protein